MRSRRLILVVAGIVALSACSDSGAGGGGATSTTVPTTTMCARSTRAAEAHGLRLTVDAAAECEAGTATVSVENTTASTCTSIISARLDGKKMIFRSTSGYGGARGRWEVAPADVFTFDGIIEYPPGRRSWLVVDPMLAAGGHHFTLSLDCAEPNAPPIVLSAAFETN